MSWFPTREPIKNDPALMSDLVKHVAPVTATGEMLDRWAAHVGIPPRLSETDMVIGTRLETDADLRERVLAEMRRHWDPEPARTSPAFAELAQEAIDKWQGISGLSLLSPTQLRRLKAEIVEALYKARGL